MDNARIHHYSKIKEFTNINPKIKLIYNVPYNPETNPIELVFNDINKILKKKKINDDNLFDKINKSLIVINKNNNFKAYFRKSLDQWIKKIK